MLPVLRRRAVLFPLTALILFAMPGCGVDPTAAGVPAAGIPIAASSQWEGPYASCPIPPADLAATTCAKYHPGSVVSAACAGGECFEMSYGYEARLVAADEHGDFPKTFFAWHNGFIAPAAGLTPCLYTDQGKKARVDIPAADIRCAVSLTTVQHLYYWHFASNPTSGCMGWVECKQY